MAFLNSTKDSLTKMLDFDHTLDRFVSFDVLIKTKAVPLNAHVKKIGLVLSFSCVTHLYRTLGKFVSAADLAAMACVLFFGNPCDVLKRPHRS